jgi:hypothetical protein
MGEDFSQSPAFQLRERPGFDDFDTVADLSLARFVVDVVFFRAFNDFVKLRVRNAGNVLNDDGFFHFIGNHHAYAGLTEVDLSVLRSLAHG